MKKVFIGIGLLAGLLMLAACRTTPQTTSPRGSDLAEEAQLATQQGDVVVQSLQQQGQVTPEPSVLDTLRTGDRLYLEVWLRDRITQLAGFPLTITISDAPDIFIPHLGRVSVVGKSVAQLRQELEGRFKLILQDPVVVLNMSRDRIRTADGRQGAVEVGNHFLVLGRVSRPGLYPLAPGMTLRDGIAMAGGLAHYAHPVLYVVRGESQHPEVIRANMTEISRGEDLSRNVQLAARDAIYVAPKKIWEVADFISTLLLPVISVRDAIWVYDRMTD